MKNPDLNPAIKNFLTIVATIILVLVPLYGFITVYFASLTGHYTAWRLGFAGLLIIGLILSAYFLLKDKNLLIKLRRLPLVWLIGGYILLEIISGVVAMFDHDVTQKALGYGLIVDLRFVIFFLVALIAARQSPWLKKHWRYLLLIPAGVVVIFGLLQHFVLPADFLQHFGYGASTIMPYETINHNLHYLRIMSSLRGANPLGAYLVIIVPAITLLWIKSTSAFCTFWAKTSAPHSDVRFVRLRFGARPSSQTALKCESPAKSRELKECLGYAVFWLASVAALYFSGSRSAWIGAALAVLIVGPLSINSKKTKKYLSFGLVVIILAAVLVGFSLHGNHKFQNEILHTQNNSAIKSTSDQGHISALKKGARDIINQPFGRGVGTAGPASVYNKSHKARIAENYFIQIGQETGWIGLIIFIMINLLVAKFLWRGRSQPLALVLLAALAGITIVNLLSHAWSDPTLAYVWWGLAGVALAPQILPEKITIKHKART